MLAEDVARFPATSRFFCSSQHDSAPSSAARSSRSVTVNNLSHSRSIHLNSINSSAAYLPYTAPNKGKSGPSIDLFKLPKRILLKESTQENEIPVFDYNEEMTDPILFVESVAHVGKQYGAVKLRMTEAAASAIRSNFEVNPDTFTFKTNRMLSNPSENELHCRLRFYSELIKFHMNNKLEDVKAEPKAEEGKSEEGKAEEGKAEEGRAEKETAVLPATDALPFDGSKQSQPDPNPVLPLTGADSATTAIKTEPIEPSLQNEPHKDKNGTGTSDAKVENEKTEADKVNSPVPKQKLPPFLTKLPMMDKRPLDLYDLFRLVVSRGGFTEVINKKLWAQVGRELGYKGKITSSLSSSLKMSYAKIIFPLENQLGPLAYELAGVCNPNIPAVPQTSKRRKANSGAPLVLGSGKEFRRSMKLKSSKGYLLNQPHLIDVKTPLVISLKDYQDDFAITNGQKVPQEKSEEFNIPIGAGGQINNYLKWLATSLALLQDSSRLELNSKMASTYTLRQYIEKDAKFQDWVILRNRGVFQNKSGDLDVIGVEDFERLYWQYLNEDFADDTKIENNSSISTCSNSSGFPRLGDDLFAYKQYLGAGQSRMVILENSSRSGSTENSAHTTPVPVDIPVRRDDFDNLEMPLHSQAQQGGSKSIGSCLWPFNLHNIPVLPNSLLGAYCGQDLSNRDIVEPCLNIGMTFSTENWKCEDHFTQLCNYQFSGDSKRWYFIPELEFSKFEDLLAETISKQNHDQELNRVNLNYDPANWDYNTLMQFVSADDETENIRYEYLVNSLENMVNPYPEVRSTNDNLDFQKIINFRRKSLKRPLFNQDYMITPQMLKERGIKFTTTVQNPGEFIFKFPKTYSASISFGFNMSEEVNFASKLWLDYGVEGEDWLKEQGLLPNILIFRLLMNFAQLYENSSGTDVHFDSEVYQRVLNLFSELIDKELNMRQTLRNKLKVKEVIIEERHNFELDTIADDDLLNAFPSRIVASDTDTHSSFVMSLSGFLEYLDTLKAGSEGAEINETIPDLMKTYHVELQLFHSDERLRTYQRLLDGYSVNFDDWMSSYEELVSSKDDVPLKTYKSLLSEGQKICSALSGINDTFFKFCLGNESSTEIAQVSDSTKTFKLQVANLQNFVDESTEIIEECQAILTLKHQQRIRNGSSPEQTINQEEEQQQASLQNLVDLVNKIPNLNFYTPEFDQIFEFKNEIQNFDKACRQLIQKGTASISELNDMISLGTSFGIKVPSLDFIVRLRDRQKWVKVFDIIVKGGDPFSGKREIFSLPDLKSFRDEGFRVLSSGDEDVLRVVDTYLLTGQEYDQSVDKYLESNKLLNDVDLNKLESILVDMEERSKMTGDARLFVSLNSYQSLVDLRAQERLISFLQNFHRQSYGLFDTRQMIADLEACSFKYDDVLIKSELEKAEAWMKDVEMQLAPIIILHKLIPIASSIKHASNQELVKRVALITAMCKANFADSTSDNFKESSGFTYIHDTQEYDEQRPIRYCLCREFEEGTMIECDKCHEWYHVHCVSSISEIGGEDDKYSCPACLVLESFMSTRKYPTFEGKISETALIDLIARGESLRIIPEAELQTLQELAEVLKTAHDYFGEQRENPEFAAYGLIYQLFLFRKIFGAPVIMVSFCQMLLDELKDADLSQASIPLVSNNGNSGSELKLSELQLNNVAVEVNAESETKSEEASDETQKTDAFNYGAEVDMAPNELTTNRAEPQTLGAQDSNAPAPPSSSSAATQREEENFAGTIEDQVATILGPNLLHETETSAGPDAPCDAPAQSTTFVPVEITEKNTRENISESSPQADSPHIVNPILADVLMTDNQTDTQKEAQ